MECYLVYEFIYYDLDEDRNEEIEFHGLYSNKKKAIDVANKRLKYGLKKYDVIVDPNIKDKTNLFNNRYSVEMYRNKDSESPVYSINIEKLYVEGRNKNE